MKCWYQNIFKVQYLKRLGKSATIYIGKVSLHILEQE